MKTISLLLMTIGIIFFVPAYAQPEPVLFPADKYDIILKDSIGKFPTGYFQSALLGRAAGVSVMPVSGQAGSAWDITIRSAVTVNSSKNPLYVIDGVPVYSQGSGSTDGLCTNTLVTLNPEDIESIAVLKGASAFALYGSRGDNGVIEIRTRGGKGKKLNIRFKMDMGFSPGFAFDNHPAASAEDQRVLKYEGYYNESLMKGYPPDRADKDALIQLGEFYTEDPRGLFDWGSALYRKAFQQNYGLDLSGKIKETSYYISVAYAKEKGYTISDGINRWSGRFNLSRKFSGIFEWNSRISYGKAEKYGFEDNMTNQENIYFAERNLLQDWWWPEDRNGDPVIELNRGGSLMNPLYYMKYREDAVSVKNLYVNESLSAEPWNGLKLIALAAFEQVAKKEEKWRSSEYYTEYWREGSLSQWKVRSRRLILRGTANWETIVSGKNFLNFTGGFEFEKNKTVYNEIKVNGFSSPYDRNPWNAKNIWTVDRESGGPVYRTWFAGGTYHYAGKYFVRGMYRLTGRNYNIKSWENVLPGNTVTLAGAASWKISEEPFLKNAGWLSDLELKVSCGKQTLRKYLYDRDKANGSLSWVDSYTPVHVKPYYLNFDIGLNAGFGNNRWNLSATYFNRTLYLKKSLCNEPAIHTRSSFYDFDNIAGKGFEFVLSGKFLKTKNWDWDFSVNAAMARNVIRITDGIDNIRGGYNFLYKSGYSVSSFYGLEYAGVNPDNGSPRWYLNKPLPDGEDKYETVGGRAVTYKTSEAKSVIIGCAEPKLYGGISTDLAWKGISLSFLFIYSLGGDAYDQMGRFMNDDGYSGGRIQGKEALKRWQNPGDITSVPKRVYFRRSPDYSQSRWIYKNNYLRLKNLALTYDFPGRLLQKIKLASLRIYFAGENLFTATEQKLFDPEVIEGLSRFRLPQMKKLLFGLEIGL